MMFPACSLTASPTEWAASLSAAERECLLARSMQRWQLKHQADMLSRT